MRENESNQRPGNQPNQPSGEAQKARLPLWPILLMLAVWFLFFQTIGGQRPSISYTRFKQELAEGNVGRLEARGESLWGTFEEPIPKPGRAQDSGGWLPLSPGQREGAPSSDRGTSSNAGESGGTPEDKAESPSQPGGESQQAGSSGDKGETIERFQSMMPPFGDDQLTSLIEKHNVEFVSHGSRTGGFWIFLGNLLPILILVGIGFLIFRGISQQARGLSSVGKSKAKKFDKERSDTKFGDVAGADKAKESLREIVSYLREPERFAKMGCRVPKGVLLVGPPGTGKTLLARAVAGEADCSFYSITGSDFMEMFVGVGASRVRDLFETAKKNKPCIIFLDELDSIGRHRGAGLGGGHDEREQTLNQLLSELDGFEPAENIVVIGATNRPDILDPALLRPGRFDRRISIDLPTFPQRVAILKVHTKKIPLGDDVDLEEIARSLPGRSGADMNNLVNEAALIAAKEGKERVNREDFSQARDQILMGQRRGGIVLREREKRAVAVHETGHALVARLTPEADPLDKVSIIPRGRSLGATRQIPEERYNLNVEYLLSRIKVMLGGRAAEELAVGTISTGAADDLKQASRLARRMVVSWGMSGRFPHLAFEEGGSEVFLGEQIAQQREYSEQTAREIDLEVKSLLERCYDETRQLLKENRERLESIAAILEDEEVLEGERLLEVFEGNGSEEHPDSETAGTAVRTA